MKTIFKYELKPEDKQSIAMPTGAKILCVKEQRDKPVLYALVNDAETEDEERFFRIYGTGHEIPEDMGLDLQYIGTFVILGGNFVGHLFEQL